MLEKWLTLYSKMFNLRTTKFDIQKFYKVLTLRLGVSYGSQKRQRVLPYATLTDWFLQPTLRVFTARYELNAYYNGRVSSLKVKTSRECSVIHETLTRNAEFTGATCRVLVSQSLTLGRLAR
jgi:hypothetical protein